MLQATIVLILLAGVLRQEFGNSRFVVASVCLWAYVANLNTDYLGGYIYQSVWELAIIVVLYFVPGKLSLLVKGLCVTAIFVNMLSWWGERFTDPTYINEAAMLGLFTVQMMFIFSTRLTDGAYRMVAGICGFCVGRNDSPKGNYGGNEK